MFWPTLLLLHLTCGSSDEVSVDYFRKLKSINFKDDFKRLEKLNGNLLKERMTNKSCTFDGSFKSYNLPTQQILDRNGIQHETHYVTSPDGYIVQFHRLPNPGKPPIYVMPGIFQSSRDFLVACPGRSLAIKLKEAGFDVWLGNYRGNSYGRNHTTLAVDTREFYNFSIDDIGANDVPAAIDYILNETGQRRVSYIGYSMGCTIIMAALSSRPEYNDKIHLVITLAPALYLDNIRTPFARFFARWGHLFVRYIETYWKSQVLPNRMTKFLHSYFPLICVPEARANRFGFCSFIFAMVDGPDAGELNYSRAPLIWGGLPSPTSTGVVTQFLQWIQTGKVRKFDFGRVKNLEKYSTVEPPIYNLTNVRVPIINFWGENDYFVAKKDVAKTVSKLADNILMNVRINWKKWNHLDFLYGKNADILVYDYVLDALNLSYGQLIVKNDNLILNKTA